MLVWEDDTREDCLVAKLAEPVEIALHGSVGPRASIA